MARQIKAKRGTVMNCPSIDVVTDLAQLNIPLHRAYAVNLAHGHNASRESQTEVVRNAGIQAILSINMQLSTNMDYANRLIANLDSVPRDSWHSVANYCRSIGIRCMGMHYKGIHSWLDYCAALGDGITLQADETWDQYRERLTVVESVQYKVASFIALLSYPLTAELTVCDRWILVAVGLLNPSKVNRSVTKGQYQVADKIVRDKAAKLGYSGPMGIFHWALWNYLRALGGDTNADDDHSRFI